MKTPRALHRTGWPWLVVVALLAVGCSDQQGDGGGANSADGAADPSGGNPYNPDDKLGLLDNAEISVQPKSLAFSAQLATETKVVSIRNVGDKGALQLLDVSLSPQSSKAFTLKGPDRMTIGPLDYVEISVTYTPNGSESDAGAVVIKHDSTYSGPITVPLSTQATGGVMKTTPKSVNFTDVPLGTNATKKVSITNVGSGPFVLTEVVMAPDVSAPDFTLEDLDFPITLAATETIDVAVTYTPDGQGDDFGKIAIHTDLPDQGEVLIPVTGNVTGPKLLVMPALVDFGFVDLNGSKTIEVELLNVGSADLVVSGAELTLLTNPAVTLEGAPAEDVVLPPTESTTFTVTFAPKDLIPYSNDALGGVLVSSNDQVNGQIVLPIFGNVAAAEMQVSPLFVDFGLVALNDVVFREVSILNSGKLPLDIPAVELADDSGGEFAIVGYDVSGWAPPGQIAEDEHVKVKLSFTNKNGSSGEAVGKLVIKSSDPTKAEVPVELSAKRAGAKECKVMLVPSSLNYGIVPHGHTKTMPVTIKNVGSGPCSYKSAKTYNCGGGFFGGMGGCTEGIGGMATNFKLIGQPPPVVAGIPQGGKATIQIMFVPPADAPLLDFFDTYNGAFQVTITDPSNNDAEIKLPGVTAPADLPVNLVAQSGISDISVIPGQVDFGLITIGCTSEETKVTIYNNGNAPLKITDLVLQDCTPEFEITQIPAIPPGGLEVTQQSPVEVRVLYTPQQEGKSYCTLAVVSDDSDTPMLTVPLEGKGTYETEWTDTFTQLSGKEVDVLFVVDNSGSMQGEQNNLSTNFSSFIKAAQAWGTNYHLGVVTTDAQGADHSGKLRGTPRFVTPSESLEDFKKNVKVGDNGNGTEEGLEAAHQALSLPLAYTSNKACAADADCTAPSSCVKGLCGGWNAGFLRDDAGLEIVFVSDEEDQSPAPLSFYIDFFKSIKGFANESLMHAHAIVGDVPKGCMTDDGEADPGKRYAQVATETGGKIGSICDANFASVLESIGDVAFGLKQQFFLTAKADPPTVKVWVSGTECKTSWKYDEPSNSVIFDLNGSCMPQEGETIEIYYKMICLHEG